MKSKRGNRPVAVRASGPPCRVWIVEDHVSVRQLLEAFVAGVPGFAVAGVGDEDGPALAAARERAVDVVILDLMIPGEGGMNSLQRFRALPEPPRVIIYSATVTAHSLKLAMAHGACGYVDKSDAIEELRTALERARAGAVHFSPRPSRVLTTLLVPEERGSGGLEQLELRVLELLARGATIKEVAHELKISSQRVYRLRQAVMERARARHAQDLVRYAIELGLVGACRGEGGSRRGPEPPEPGRAGAATT